MKDLSKALENHFCPFNDGFDCKCFVAGFVAEKHGDYKTEKNYEDLLFAYYRACEALTEKFIKIYYCDPHTPVGDMDWFWVGDDIGGVLFVNDDYWSFEDVKVALAYEIPKNTLFAWHSDSLDHAMENQPEQQAERLIESFKDMFNLLEAQAGVSERERFIKEFCKINRGPKEGFPNLENYAKLHKPTQT